jgi:hypothetical protein
MESQVETHGEGIVFFKIEIGRCAQFQPEIRTVLQDELVIVIHPGEYGAGLKTDAQGTVLGMTLEEKAGHGQSDTQYLCSYAFHTLRWSYQISLKGWPGAKLLR